MTTKTYSLVLKHQQLDAALCTERARRWPDVMRILKIKKMKLAIKDRLRLGVAEHRSPDPCGWRRNFCPLRTPRSSPAAFFLRITHHGISIR
jgi:uncharacterized protein